MRKIADKRDSEKLFHAARSEFLDAFAKLEATIRFVQNLAGLPDRSEPLIEKLAALRDPARCPGFSERRGERVRSLLENMEDLIYKRNTVVHSIMSLDHTALTGSEARFINPKCHADGTYHGFRFTIEDMRKLICEVELKSQNLSDPQMLG